MRTPSKSRSPRAIPFVLLALAPATRASDDAHHSAALSQGGPPESSQDASPEAPPHAVHFDTEDGQALVADWYLHDAEGPTVIGLPMFRNVRASWQPLAAPLRQRGINLLALDLRGHGESAPKLADAIASRDPEVFGAMHLDVAAALEHLRREGLDTTRVAVAGASVGCSIAVDAATRRPGDLRALVLMTPGAKYLGVDTLEDIGAWKGQPTLLLCSTEERRTSRPVADALTTAAPESFTAKWIEGQGIHGTRMFGEVDGIEERIAEFLAQHLETPDLAIPRFDADDDRVGTAGFFGRTLRTGRLTAPSPADAEVDPPPAHRRLMAFAVGDTLTLGALTDQSFEGSVEFQVGAMTFSLPWNTAEAQGPIPARSTGSIDTRAQGQPGSFRGQHWVNLELPLEDVLPGAHGPLRLVWKPKEGPALALPGGPEPFHARTVPAPR